MPQQIETTQTALRDAISAVAPIVERHNTIPILGSVLIENGYVRATNLDIEIRAAFGMSGKIKTPFAIGCGQVARLVKHIDEGEAITISEGDGKTAITFNGSSYSVPQYPGTDFPDFNGGEFGEGSLTGNAGIIAAIKRVLFAVSNEETRYYLNGACLSLYHGKPCVIATDGHRLAMVEIPFLPTGATNQIIPIALLKYLVSRKAEPERMMFMESDDPKRRSPRIAVDFPGLRIKAKLIDGTYPDFTRVILKDAPLRMTFDRVKMLNVLKRMLAFNGGTAPYYGRSVKLAFGTGGNIKLTLDNPDIGGGTEILSACKIEDNALGFTVAFNVKYLIEALSALHAETLEWREDDAGSPVVLTGEGDALTTVLMPMRVSL